MSSGPNSSSEREQDILWGILGVIAVVMLVVLYRPEWFVVPWMTLKTAEVWVLQWLPMPNANTQSLDRAYTFLTSRSVNQIGLSEMKAVQRLVWQTARWVYVPIIALMGVAILARKQFKKHHTKASLIKQESKNWPWIRNLSSLGMENKSISDKKYGFRRRPKEEQWYKKAIKGGVLDAEIARKAFAKQLGSMHSGVQSLDKTLSPIVAISALVLSRKTDDVMPMMRRLCSDERESAMRECEKIIARNKDLPAIKAAESTHAYQITVVMEILLQARKGMAIPPNWFSTLKLTNRAYWYAIEDLGMAVSSVEAGGIRAHFLFEQESQRGVKKPQIEQAVEALQRKLEQTGVLQPQRSGGY